MGKCFGFALLRLPIFQTAKMHEKIKQQFFLDQRFFFLLFFAFFRCTTMHMCVCVCVCVKIDTYFPTWNNVYVGRASFFKTRVWQIFLILPNGAAFPYQGHMNFEV